MQAICSIYFRELLVLFCEFLREAATFVPPRELEARTRFLERSFYGATRPRRAQAWVAKAGAGSVNSLARYKCEKKN